MKQLSQSLRDDKFVQNPYPFYEKARKLGHLFFWKEYGMVAATSYQAASLLFRDRAWGREIPEDQASASPNMAAFDLLAQNSMLELDPPRHTRLRGLVNRAFTSKFIAELEPEIEMLAHSLIDHFDKKTELQKNFSELLPVLVIAKLIGVDTSMCKQMLTWSHDMVAMYQAKKDHAIELRAEQAAQEFAQFIQDEISCRSVVDDSSLLSRLTEVRDEEGKLTTDELVSTCILLLNAGHEATSSAIGNGVKIIVESGLNRSHILSPSLRASTVEEILRFDPPLHIFERQAKIDTEVFGHKFCQGDRVALILAAANRDTEVWDNSDKFLPERKVKAHTSFGAGIHFCIGAPLARLELAVGLSTLFQRHPKMSLVGTPRYADKYHFHGLEELWVLRN